MPNRDLFGLPDNIPSFVRVSVANGYGASAANVLRFSKVDISIGNSIIFYDSPDLGSSFTITQDGLYSMMSQIGVNGIAAYGIGKNATPTELGTGAGGLSPTTKILGNVSGLTSSTVNQVYAVDYLLAGDVVRVHTDGDTTAGGQTMFQIARVG